MSQYSKMKQSREQWKAKAIERGQAQRYQRKQSARHKATAEQKTKALEAAQARIRELEAQLREVTTRPKVEVVHFALPLFLEARIGFRAVSRVLTLLASALGIKKAPCPQSVIHWVMRLAIVRIDSARHLRGLPLPQAPFCNGLIWMIDLSSGLGTGKILAVLAFDAHHQLHPGALGLAQVHCLGVSVAASWTGEAIAEVLKRLIAVMGRPAAYLKDRGSELSKAVDLLAQENLASACIDDISHAAASMLKARLPKSPRFRGLLVGLWSGLRPLQANDSSLFGPTQRAHQSPLYECPPPLYLGGSGAQALTGGRGQSRFDFSSASRPPRSFTAVQSPHQAFSGRCARLHGV